jgi:hypothetical protein
MASIKVKGRVPVFGAWGADGDFMVVGFVVWNVFRFL